MCNNSPEIQKFTDKLFFREKIMTPAEFADKAFHAYDICTGRAEEIAPSLIMQVNKALRAGWFFLPIKRSLNSLRKISKKLL